jgi:hypothetical protein
LHLDLSRSHSPRGRQRAYKSSRSHTPPRKRTACSGRRSNRAEHSGCCNARRLDPIPAPSAGLTAPTHKTAPPAFLLAGARTRHAQRARTTKLHIRNAHAKRAPVVTKPRVQWIQAHPTTAGATLFQSKGGRKGERSETRAENVDKGHFKGGDGAWCAFSSSPSPPPLSWVHRCSLKKCWGAPSECVAICGSQRSGVSVSAANRRHWHCAVTPP